MNEWVQLGLIAAAVIVPATIITMVIVVKKFYNHRAIVFENDSSGHLLPMRSYKVARRKKENLWNLKFFDRLFWNFSVVDKDYVPFTENANRLYFFFRDRKGFLHDMGLDVDSVKEVYKVKCIPTDVFATQQAILHNLNARYDKKNWFDKYGTILIGASLGALLVFAIIYQGHVTGQMADKAAGITDRCFQGCQQLYGNLTQNLTAFRVS